MSEQISGSRLYLITGKEEFDNRPMLKGSTFIPESRNEQHEPPGWYFSDECEMLRGPYGSVEECIKMRNEYEP